VGCSSSAEGTPSVAAFSARTGVADALDSGVSKVDGVKPTAAVYTNHCC